MAIISWRACIRATVLAGALAMLSSSIGTEPQALSIRTGTGLRYRLSQGVGEEQLAVLSRTAAVEDAWLFVGDTWIDVGYREEPKDVLVDLQLAAAAVHHRYPAGTLAFYWKVDVRHHRGPGAPAVDGRAFPRGLRRESQLRRPAGFRGTVRP
jgi:hypothetical protein